MSADKAITPHSGNAVAEVINAAQSLAESIGPEWGLAFLVAIFVFLPKYGVLVHLASLFKEDRADTRKRKVETKRLESKFRNRRDVPLLPAPKRGDERESDQ